MGMSSPTVGELNRFHKTMNCFKQDRDHLRRLDELKRYYSYKPIPGLPSSTPNLSTRFKVLERDGFKCVYCGRSPQKDNDVELHVDHVFPRSRGGLDSMENLVAACKECNLGKLDYVLRIRRR